MAVITGRCIRLSELRVSHARAHVGDTQEGGRPYVLTGSKPRKSPGAPPACAPLPPPPTSRRQHFLLFRRYPFGNRLGFNHSHVVVPELLPYLRTLRRIIGAAHPVSLS